MKTILYIFLLALIISCNDTAEKIPMEKLAYDFCSSLKLKDKQKYTTYFSSESINSASIGQFDYVYNNAAAIVSKYELPSFEYWKTNRIFYQNDSANNRIRIGLPFIGGPTSTTPESYFLIGYDNEQKFTGFNIQNVTTYKDLPDRMFPNKKEKFDFSEHDLISVRIYFLPGQNTEVNKSKSVEFKENELTASIKSDFKNVIDVINSSKIESAEKGAIQEQSNTNDLKAIVFHIKDGNEVLTLSVLNPTQLEKYIEVNTFYTTNAAILYQLSEKNKSEIQKLLDTFVIKYIN